ncbi:L-aspartate oxidase, partial [Patescibacteria group bacterium]|nr:L-aspartate oxidase [Patescibacteria group bacterium]
MNNPTFLVIGSGIAGLNFAIKASKYGRVLILTKSQAEKSNTYKAQGGIAAVLSNKDSLKKHIKDTLECGSFHNKKSAVEYLVKNGPSAIDDLLNYGVRFKKNKKGLLVLTKEGGHNQGRVAYAGDFTGKEIIEAAIKTAQASPNIQIIENAFVIDLILKKKICLGAKIIIKNKIKNLYAPYTILATGGAGQVFKHTTNPTVATGDGIGIASRANLKFKDLEFIQFHPTALNIPNQKVKFLLSEALRGEGAILVNEKEQRYMKKHHPTSELAPRDIVAKFTYLESLKNPVFLRFKNKTVKELKERFPIIFNKLKDHGLNLAKDRIPITPAAHYLCGGIKTTIAGQTPIKNFHVIGEAAGTQIHGANRLASNSLLEAMVCSSALASSLSPQKIKKNLIKFEKHNQDKTEEKTTALTKTETEKLKKIRKKIKEIMWQNVGIVRKKENLTKTIETLNKLQKTMTTIKNHTNKSFYETQNLLTAAQLI